jgi:threonine dehydratase
MTLLAETDTPAPALPIGLGDIEAAAARLAGKAVRTPLLRSPFLDELLGATVLIKPEVLQRTGSFKFRGAFNRLSQVPEAERARGVVAWSSGNHAQGVAAAARLLGMPAVIVMPADAPAIKIANTRAYGADVVTYDRFTEDREAIGRSIAAERGATVVPPFDDPGVMAGQGTAGLELATDAAALGLVLDDVLVPASGGGLVAGIATAVRAHMPGARVWSVEPEGFDDLARSLAEGRRVANAPGARSICDALLVERPGELTFAVNRWLLAGGFAVGEPEVLAAMALAADRLKLVVEPGGAVALAALLAGRIPARGRTVAVVLSGGNVDAPMLARALGQAG